MSEANNPSHQPLLVTGATGLVGSHLVEELLRRGQRVTCLVRQSSRTEALDRLPVTILRTDFLEDPDGLIKAVSGHRVIFHVAGAVRALDLAGFQRTNVDVTQELLDACLAAPERPERFVLVSSVAAAGPPRGGERLTETQEPQPVSDYGRSKLEGERRALRAAGSIKVLVLRPTAIYGPRDREMLPIFRLAQLGVVLAPAGREQVVNLCHVVDIARGIAQAGEAPLDSGEVIQLGATEEYTMQEVGEIFCRLFERRPQVFSLPRPALDAAAWASESWARMLGRPAMLNRQKVPELLASWSLDLSAARVRLGYAPRWDLPAGAADTLGWYRREKWL